MSYILLKKAYIANTREMICVTLGGSDKLCNCFIQVHIQGNKCSLASHTLCRERKGLVMLQLPSCRRGMQLSTIAVW